jgi:hypothetical protein
MQPTLPPRSPQSPQPITLGQCFRGSWRDTGRAIRGMPALFLIAFVLVGLTIAGSSAFLDPSDAAATLTATGGALGRHASMGNSLTLIAIEFVQWVVLAVLAVQVIRYAMSASAEPGADSRIHGQVPAIRLWDAGVRRYFVLCILMATAYVGMAVGVVLVVLVLRLLGVTGSSSYAASATLAVLGLCGMSYVWARLSLLFPHTATGGQLRWRAAWNDSRTHFWMIATTAVVVILPVMAVSTIISVMAELMQTLDSVAAVTYGVLVIQSAATLLYAASTATCSVWLYRRYAAQLVQAAD